MRIHRAFCLSVLAACVASLGCVPHCDPKSTAVLTETKNASADKLAATCTEGITYENGKNTSARSMYDKTSVKHITAACDCLKAAGTSDVRKQACLAEIDAYLQYEKNKCD